MNSADVNAVFVHVPQGREFAQLGNAVLQCGDDKVDFFLGGEAADGHAQRAVRQLVAATQGTQHVAGLQAGRRAGRSRRHSNAFDAHDQRLTFNIVEGNVQIVRNATLQIPVEEDLFDVLQTLVQTLLQGLDACVFFGHFRLGNAEGFAHAHDLVGGQGARTHTALVTAAVHLRFQADARLTTHVQSANALGAVGLVRGQAHQVDGQLGHVDVDLAGGLGRVDVEDDALFTAQCADGWDVLDHANFVVHEHDRDQYGVGTDGGLEHVHVQQTVFFDVQVGGLKALTLQLTHGVQHSLVLGLDRDDVLAARLVEVRCALEGQVVGFSRAGCPDDFTRIGTDQLGHLRACGFHSLLCFPTIGVGTRCRVAKVLAQPGDHGVDHARVARRGGAVVHVNREVWGHVHGGDSS